MNTAIWLLSLFLVGLLGFAAHRASLCTVRAVAEVLNTRRANVLLSFAKTALWAMAVSLPILLWWPASGMAAQAYAFSAGALAGGFLFGVGAGLNGGCAFSTLSRLADGELWMLATLAGFCLGVVGWTLGAGTLALTPPPPLPLSMTQPGTRELVLLAGLWLWAAWELRRLWRTRSRELGWRARLCASPYRLSTAALVLGVSSGALYTLLGAWTYTTTLKRAIEALLRPDAAGPSVLLNALFLALISGMLLSSWQRGSLHPRWRGGWLRRFCGGLLMGLGGALLPGGNDELILRAIPMLSPHALPAYLALLAGVACALLMLDLAQGRVLRAGGSGDARAKARR